MEPERLAVLGAGSVRCMPAVIGSLATYFGERPIEVRLFDADAERLDLFDRLARLSFSVGRAPHGLISTEDAAEAVEGADRIVLALDDHGAICFLRRHRRQGVAALPGPAMVEQALEPMLARTPASVLVLSLLPSDVNVPVARYWRLDWPEAPSEDALRATPHKVLRLLYGDEPLHPLLAENERSPLKQWLNDPRSADLVWT